MAERLFNRRPWNKVDIPPMRVSDAVIARCREEIEPRWKRKIRAFMRPWMLWRLRLAEAGEGFQWGQGERIAGARFGRYASIGGGGSFSGPVVIGDLTMLSTETQVIGQDHVFTDVTTPTRIHFSQVPRPVTVIEADVWIGARVTIMEGVTIGRGSVIGANSIVTRDIPPYSLVVGAPARVTRPRFTPEQQALHDALLYGDEAALHFERRAPID